MRSIVTVLGRSLIAVFLAVLFVSSNAQARGGIQPCSITGIPTFDPPHPMATTTITYSVGLFAIDTTGYTVVSRITQPGSNQIELDLIVTRDLSPFPDYGVATVPEHTSSAQGTIGPLPVGEYKVATQLRVYDEITRALTPVCNSSPYENLLTVYAEPLPSLPVVEFYHAGMDHYFLTQDVGEIRDLDTGVHSGWARTGGSFLAYTPGGPQGHVSRFYGLPSAGLDTHVYVWTISAEYFNLLWHDLSSAWRLESQNAFEPAAVPDAVTGACPASTVPVYRLWNQRADSNHRYTTDLTTKAEMVARGWVPEGYGPDAVFFCALG